MKHYYILGETKQCESSVITRPRDLTTKVVTTNNWASNFVYSRPKSFSTKVSPSSTWVKYSKVSLTWKKLVERRRQKNITLSTMQSLTVVKVIQYLAL